MKSNVVIYMAYLMAIIFGVSFVKANLVFAYKVVFDGIDTSIRTYVLSIVPSIRLDMCVIIISIALFILVIYSIICYSQRQKCNE